MIIHVHGKAAVVSTFCKAARKAIPDCSLEIPEAARFSSNTLITARILSDQQKFPVEALTDRQYRCLSIVVESEGGILEKPVRYIKYEVLTPCLHQ